MVASLKPLDRKKLYNATEFDEIDFPRNGNSYELIQGEIVMTPPPGDRHGKVADIITKYIHRFDLEDKLGEVRQNSCYKISETFVPAPDLAFTVAARLQPTVDGAVPTRPDLAVEILSPHDTDSRKRLADAYNKIRLYQLGKVPLVWLINPKTKIIEVFEPTQIEPVATLGENDNLSFAELIPGLTIPIKVLFG